MPKAREPASRQQPARAAATSLTAEQLDDHDSGSHNKYYNNNEHSQSGLVIASAVGDYSGDAGTLAPAATAGGRVRAHKLNIMYWDQRATRLLIALRIELEPKFADKSNGRTRVSVWQEVAERMAEQGYDFGADKANKKWSNIQSTYQRQLERQANGQPVNWEYFQDMHDYIHNHRSSGAADGAVAAIESDYSEDDEDEDDPDIGLMLDMSPQLGTPAARSSLHLASASSMNRSGGKDLNESQLRQHLQEQQRQLQNASPLLVPLASVAFGGGGGANKRKSNMLNASDHLLDGNELEGKHGRPKRTVRKPLAADEEPAKENQLALPLTKMQRLSKRRQSSFVVSGKSMAGNISHEFLNVAVPKNTAAMTAKQAIEDAKKMRFSNAASAVSATAVDDCDEEDPEAKWTRDYFERKLELERERLRHEQERHRDYMQFQHMNVVLHEKLEKNKLEALKALTEAINRLI